MPNTPALGLVARANHLRIPVGRRRLELFVVVDLTALGDPVESARPDLVVQFVLDTSGSMRGFPLRQVQHSVERLARLLAPTDHIGVVEFNDAPTVVVEMAPLSPVQRRLVIKHTHALHAGGGTQMHAALAMGCATFPERIPHRRHVVLLLTDGMPTDDSTAESLAALARSFRPDVSTTTLGYGPKHNAAILDSIAQAGGGQYWYIPDPSEADVEFARALGAQCDVVADGVELVLTPGPGVEIAEVLGRAKTRVTAEGVVVPRPDMRAHEQLTTVVRLLVHVDLEPGRLLPLRVTAHHRRAGETTVQTVSTDVVVAGGHGEGELDIDVHRKVTLARAEQRREDAWKEAECRRFTQAIELLEGAIEDLRALPGHQPQDGSDVSEAIEQLFDEVRMYSRAPSREDCFAFRSSTRGTEFTQGTRHPADHAMASAKSRALFAGVLDHGVGGAVWVSSRAAAPQVFPLLPEMTIGRGHNNVIPVLDSDVSRRHARLFCKDGQVFVVDLQSVTGTTVNGERIRTTRALRPGDVVCVGNTHIEVSLSPTR